MALRSAKPTLDKKLSFFMRKGAPESAGTTAAVRKRPYELRPLFLALELGSVCRGAEVFEGG
jgi:hypothetical protein